MSVVPTVCLYAEFTAREGLEGEVESLITRFAETVRGLEGTVSFEVHRHVARPRRFFVYEVYADQATFDRQMHAPENAEFNARIADLIEEPETQLTWLGGALEAVRD